MFSRQHPHQAYQFLLKESHGCYDVSDSTVRHCLVINKTTKINTFKANQDCQKIQETMTALKFNVSTPNSYNKWKDTLKYCKFYLNY